jgi:Peptidase family M3
VASDRAVYTITTLHSVAVLHHCKSPYDMSSPKHDCAALSHYATALFALLLALELVWSRKIADNNCVCLCLCFCVYHTNSAMLRQLYLGQLDMELHHRYNPQTSNETPFDIQKKVAAKYLVVQPLPEDRFLCAFTHILGGGYAAGTYTYIHIHLY